MLSTVPLLEHKLKVSDSKAVQLIRENEELRRQVREATEDAETYRTKFLQSDRTYTNLERLVELWSHRDHRIYHNGQLVAQVIGLQQNSNVKDQVIQDLHTTMGILTATVRDLNTDKDKLHNTLQELVLCNSRLSSAVSNNLVSSSRLCYFHNTHGKLLTRIRFFFCRLPASPIVRTTVVALAARNECFAQSDMVLAWNWLQLGSLVERVLG
jgi:hypothetical protein